MAMALAACPEEDLADLEAAYMRVLEGAETYEIAFDQLTIKSAEGAIIFTANREPLLGTKWELVSMGDIENPQPPVEDSNFSALFNRLPTLPSGTVVGDTGCNEWNATFSSNLTEIKVNLPFKSNNEECPAGLMEQEQQFFLGLNAATEFHILGNRLYIPYGEADSLQVLNFQAAPPDAEEGEGLDLTPLAETFWYLRSIGDNALISHTEIKADFEIDEGGLSGTISGSSGCNAYNGSVDGTNGTFDVGPLGTTSKACETDVMDQEGGYLDWLTRAYAYDRAGDQLLISTEHGILTYQSTPVLDQTQELQTTTWHLVTVGTLDAVPGSKATALFAGDGHSLSGFTGCNNFHGSYRTEPGNKLAISGFTSNLAACPSEELAKQEDALLIFLPSAISYIVIGTQMQIQTIDGSVINYTSVTPAKPVGPTAVINAPEHVDLGQLFNFDGSGSKAGDTSIIRYEWDMGDGTIITGPAHSYAYNAAGTYQVTLTVADQAGLTDTAEHTVVVRPVVEVVPPTAVINGPTHAFTNDTLTFDGSGSMAGDSPIATYAWDMGDGTTLKGATVEHAYNAPNSYEVRLTVTDEDGKSNSASQMILVQPTVEAVPPTAVIEGPASAFVGDRVSFSASSSTEGSAAISGYQWQSSDGNNTGPGADSGFTTVYVQPGTYYPAVTVTDADGLSDSASMAITINADLQGADWILSNTIPGTTISLVFGNGSLSGFAGCNSYNGTYRVPGKSNNVKVDPITSTGALCSEEIMNQESNYLAALQSASNFAINGNSLTLTTSSGTLTFYAAVATPTSMVSQ
jgi:heat shock protein HslJ/chitodextrinase